MNSLPTKAARKSSLVKAQQGNSTPFPDGSPLPDLHLNRVINKIPVAIYTTDNQGYITYFNPAAADLWGKQPEIGKELWCGSWKIFMVDGQTEVSLGECPMAIMLKERKKVPGFEIIVERPDGSRRNVIPYPEPLLDHNGEMVGGINTLIDVTEKNFGEEAKARFEAIIESSEDGIISKTLEGYITSWNDSARRIFGYTEDEMIGKHITTLIPGERLQEETYIINKIRNGERVETFETQRVSKSGELLDISLTISPIKNNKGEIIGASKIVRDITRQKKLQRQIAESELFFKSLANASPAALWLTNKDKENIFISESWLKWTGKSSADQLEKGWMSQVSTEDRDRIVAGFNYCFNDRSRFVAEFSIEQPNGQNRWCMTEAMPYYDDNKEFAGYAGSITDITTIRELEKRKDDFIKMASHELKTPITSVNGYVQLLINIFNDNSETELLSSRPTVKSSLYTISRQVSKLTRLISELLDLTRIESGKLELNRTEFRLDELVEESVQEARHTTSRHAILFNNDFKGTIYADRDRIGQVIANVLNNAIKYSRDADSVEVSVDEEEGMAVVRVTDYGIGIAPEEQLHIFERFYRVGGKSEQTYPGFGIGLFIANEIVQRHDGYIRVNSEKGKGATFIIKLPLSNNKKTQHAAHGYSSISGG